MPKRGEASLPVDLPAEGICSALGVDAESGLSDADAGRRHRREGENNIFGAPRTSVWRYAGYCSFDLLLIILLLTAVTASVFGEKLAYAVIVPTIFLSIVLRTAAYIAARRSLDACASAESVMPYVTVLRSGEKKRIDARRVVRGDILYLSKGDIVPADCRLIDSSDLSVYEEASTGVSGIVKKDADSDGGASLVSRANTVYAGSSVIAGDCRAVVMYIGGDTLVVRTRGRFKTTRGGTLRLSRLLDSYSRKWGAVMALVAFAVTVLDLFFGGRSLFEVFFLGLSLAAATMCEYYSAIGDIAAAYGISALRKKCGVSVRGVRSIETLAELEAVIVPAEGVVVRDGVECRAYFYDGKIADAASDGSKVGGGDDDNGGGDVSENETDGGAPRTPETLLRYAAMATQLGGGEGERSEASSAVCAYLKYTDFDGENIYHDGETPILFAGKADGLAFDTRLLAYGDAYLTVSCGAARDIVSACAFLDVNGNKTDMTGEVRSGLLRFIAHHERRGATAIAVAKKNTPFRSTDRIPFTQFDMTLVGIMMIYRSLAEGAADAVSACRRSGIRVIMTGDGIEAARLAERAGIISGKDDIITGWEFSEADDAKRKTAAANARLLVGFDQRRMKEFIKAAGDPGKLAYVASDSRDMLGELSALTSVGAGFSLTDGKNGGTETLRMRADNIVPRADGEGGGLFSVISSVAFAKRIYKNISNIANYLLTSQLARIFAVLFSVIFPNMRITPQEILLWGLIFDLIAIFMLALETPDEKSLSEKTNVYERLSHPVARLLPAIITGLLWAAPTMLAPLLYRGSGEMRDTVIFVSVLLSLVVVSGEFRSGYPVFSGRRRYSIAAFMTAGAVSLTVIAMTVIPSVSPALALARPDGAALLISVIPAAVQLAVYEAARFLRAVGNGVRRDVGGRRKAEYGDKGDKNI